MDSLAVDLIGFTAGFLMAVTMVPQIVRSLKTKSVEDLSMLMLIIYATSSVLWTIYGLLIGSLAVAVTDGFAFCISLTQLYLKIRYTKR